MNAAELQFIIKAQDQASSTVEQVGSSFADMGKVIQQQVAAMQALTAALTQNSGALTGAAAAEKAHEAGLRAVNAALNQNVESTKKAEVANRSLVGSMNELRDGATALVTTFVGLYAANKAIKAPLDAYREQESALKKIGLAANLTKDQVQALHDELDKSALTNGKATIDQLEQFAVMGARLGGTADQIKKFALAVGGLAKGDLSVGDKISNILTATNEGAEGAERLVASLKALGGTARSGLDGVTNMTQMLGNFTAGLDIAAPKLVAYAATFDKVFGGTMARRATAQFGVMMQTITKQAEEGGEGLRDLAERFGESYDQMQKLGAEHPDEVFSRILTVVNALKTAGQNPTDFLKEFGISGGRAVQTVEALAAKTKELNANMALVNDPDKLAARAKLGGDQNKKGPDFDDIQKSLNVAKSAWRDFKVEVGKDIAPEVIAGLKGATEAIKAFTALVRGTPQEIRWVIEALLILGPALSNIGKIAGLLGGQYKVLLSLLGIGFNSAAKIAVTATEEIAGAEAALVAGSKSRWLTAANAVKGYQAALIGLSLYETYQGAKTIGEQQKNFSRQGISAYDQWLGLKALFSGDKTDLIKNMQSEQDAGTLHLDRGPLQRPHTATPETAYGGQEQQKTLGDVLGGAESAKTQLSPFNEQIRKALEYRKTAEDLKSAIDKLSDAQKAQFAAEIAGSQQALQLRQAELDPLNKMRDDWVQAMHAAQAYTATQKEAAEIEKKVFDARKDAYSRGEGDQGANKAEGAVRQQEGALNAAKRSTEYAKELSTMTQSLAMAGALTQTEKDRLGVEQQIANLARDKSYTQGQLDQLKQVLDLTKQIEREMGQFNQLNPQAAALRNYADSLKTLNERFKGNTQDPEYKRERTKLDQDTLASRDPVGAIVQSQKEEIQQLQVVGKYRDADLKTLQQITDLKKQGVLSDDAQSKAIEKQLGSNNRMIQDVKDLQGMLDSLTQSFGSGLSQAIGGALNGQKYAFDKFLAGMGQKMMDMVFTNLAKSFEPNLSGLLGGLVGDAKAGADRLGKLGADQAEKTMATASQTIASADIKIAQATIMGANAADQAKQAGDAAANPLPAPSGTTLTAPGGAAAAAAPSSAPSLPAPGAVSEAAAAAATGAGGYAAANAARGGAFRSTGAASPSDVPEPGATPWGTPSPGASNLTGPIAPMHTLPPGVTKMFSGDGPTMAAPGLAEGIKKVGDLLGMNKRPTASAARPAGATPEASVPSAASPASAAPGASSDLTTRFPNTIEGRAAGQQYFAEKYGVNPDLAKSIATHEGNNRFAVGPNQASTTDIDKATGKPFSFGDYQLNYKGGLGNALDKQYGLKPTDPDFYLKSDEASIKYMSEHGFGPWKGDKGLTAWGNKARTQAPMGGHDLTTLGKLQPHPQQPPAASPQADASGMADPKAYLNQTAFGNAKVRTDDIAKLNPEFATKLADAVKDARSQGMKDVGVFSGARPPEATLGHGKSGAFDQSGQSLHPVGMATDIYGIGKPGSAQSYQWNDIATKHGLYNPYGPDHHKEWNHYQAVNDKAIDPKGPLGQFYRDGHQTPARQQQMWDEEEKLYGLKAHPDRPKPIQSSKLDSTPLGSIKQSDSGQLSASLQAAKSAQDAIKQTTQSTTQNLTSLTGGIGKVGTQAMGAVPDISQFSQSITSMVSSLGKGGGGGGGGLGGLFGGGGGGGLFGGGGGDFGGFGDFASFHTGGLVGANNNRATFRLPVSTFRNAPRFHDGMGSDEFPAVLQRGERVLTANQDQRATAMMGRMVDMLANTSTPAGTQHAPSGRQRGGANMTMIVNTPNASSFRASQPQIMATQHAAMARSGAKHN